MSDTRTVPLTIEEVRVRLFEVERRLLLMAKVSGHDEVLESHELLALSGFLTEAGVEIDRACTDLEIIGRAGKGVR